MEGDGKTMIGAAGLVGSEGERSSSMLSSSMPSITGRPLGLVRSAPGQALDLAIHTACGVVRADAARGLLLRHDHGSAFMSDHFQNQIAFLGMTPELCLRPPAQDQWCGGAVRSAPSRSRSCGAGSSAMPRRFAARSGPSSRARTSTGCWRRMPTAARLRPGANGSPHSPQSGRRIAGSCVQKTPGGTGAAFSAEP